MFVGSYPGKGIIFFFQRHSNANGVVKPLACPVTRHCFSGCLPEKQTLTVYESIRKKPTKHSHGLPNELLIHWLDLWFDETSGFFLNTSDQDVNNWSLYKDHIFRIYNEEWNLG